MSRDSKGLDAYALAGSFQFKMPRMQVLLDAGYCLSYWKQYVCGGFSHIKLAWFIFRLQQTSPC